MPKIVRSGGIHFTDDVVKIRDIVPTKQPPKKADPAALDIEDQDGALLSAEIDAAAEDEGFMPEETDEPALQMNAAAVAPAPEAVRFGTAEQNALREEIIQGAMAEAGRILEDAVRGAEEQKAAALAGIQDEAERLRAAAAEEGRKEGFAAVVGDMQQAAGQLEAAIADFEGGRAGFEAEYETQLKWMALEIASKVLAKKVDEDDAVMADMVQKAVQSVRNEAWIRVEVSQEMVRLIDKLTEIYAGQPGIEISGVSTAPGTVQIETPSGLMDASLQTQLANLREYFTKNSNF
ncbi:hypothetical protein LJC04_04685 [Ruminococcaceae bacterium OttesenSCG-928-O06]|nr:hypothetical protein [Ruminococcaceae bacterium OttesenSCG-928-O06]